MNKLKYCLILLQIVFCVLFTACGSKKSPMGGPVDTIKPTILNITPNNYEQIVNNTISITFSKPIDKNTVNSSIQIYPPILNKKLTWNNNTLTIKIQDDLKDNTNYFLNISSGLKCSHGNTLENSISYIFKNGNLNNEKVSGNFLYEDETDKLLSKRILLLDTDSLLILEKNLTDNNFLFDNLNKQDFILRTFIDKNKNNRYDPESEPYFQSDVFNKLYKPLQIKLAYADTTKPDIKNIKALSKNDIEVVFTKKLLNMPHVLFIDENKSSSLPILASSLENNTAHFITSDQDTIKYRVTVNQLVDSKLNTSPEKQLYMNGSDKSLTTPLKIISTNPRTGAAITESRPRIKIIFSEIMLSKNVHYSLIEMETNKSIPISIIEGNAKSIVFMPDQPLKKFNSYTFKILKKTHNHHNLELANDTEILFLITDKKK